MLKVRKSLQDLPQSFVKKVHYSDLPDELDEFSYWIGDSGYCLTVIPECLIGKAEKSGNLYMYEVPIPVKYVIERGYRFHKGFLVCEVKYDNDIGAIVPPEYDYWG